MTTWECPTCEITIAQPSYVTAVGHECPSRRRDRCIAALRPITTQP